MSKCNCGFCEKYVLMREGKNNERLKIENEKFIVVFDNKEGRCFDIFYCPFCGKKLRFNLKFKVRNFNKEN